MIAEFRQLVGLPEGRSQEHEQLRTKRGEVADEEEGTGPQSSGSQPTASTGATWKGRID